MAQHPGHRFFTLIVADLADPAPFQLDDAWTPVMLHAIEVPNLAATAMKYDILELNTNVKPTFLKYLITTYALEGLVYLDPDIFVYRPLDPVFETLDAGSSAVLTPHMTQPVLDGKTPSEQDLLYNGTYNLGFIAVGSSVESQRLLDWWEVRCLQSGFSEGRTGLFVDQKWMNLAPGLFGEVHISRDPGLNMAYWNLHERVLRQADRGFEVESPDRSPVPLRFFHFSGLDLTDDAVISRNSNRFTAADRPDLRELFTGYKKQLAAHRGTPAESLPYGFDRLSDGTTLTRLARRLFAAHETHFSISDQPHHDPFNAKGEFARFARRQGLLKGAEPPQKASWQEFNGQDRRVHLVHRMLRLALRLLGPNRYELLMRYLAFITVLRHQGVFLRNPDWPQDAGRGGR